MADNVAITAGSGTTVGTDERTVSGTSVQVQRVDEQGATAIASGQVTVSNSAVDIVAARDTRKSVTIVNRQTVAIYVGPTSATTSHFRLDPGDSHTFRATSAIQGIASAAYTAVGDAKVHYSEEYDS